MRRRTLLLVVSALFAVAGCGGEEPPTRYALSPTLTCLKRENVRVRTMNLDFVASTAFGGAVNVRFPRRINEVTLAFGESEEDAARLERAYRRFAPKRVRIEDVLRRELNVVLLWGVVPSAAHESTIRGCLRG